MSNLLHYIQIYWGYFIFLLLDFLEEFQLQFALLNFCDRFLESIEIFTADANCFLSIAGDWGFV